MMKTYHGRSDTKTFKIINFGNTIAGDSIYYRKNNVSKENFYKKYVKKNIIILKVLQFILVELILNL